MLIVYTHKKTRKSKHLSEKHSLMLEISLPFDLTSALKISCSQEKA